MGHLESVVTLSSLPKICELFVMHNQLLAQVILCLKWMCCFGQTALECGLRPINVGQTHAAVKNYENVPGGRHFKMMKSASAPIHIKSSLL